MYSCERKISIKSATTEDTNIYTCIGRYKPNESQEYLPEEIIEEFHVVVQPKPCCNEINWDRIRYYCLLPIFCPLEACVLICCNPFDN